MDADLFAVNIAKLRLWLSLVVDYSGDKPPPLPNLDFKIECGDSLTAPDPQRVTDLFRSTTASFADELIGLKGRYITTYGAEKKALSGQIKEIEGKLREDVLTPRSGRGRGLAGGVRRGVPRRRVRHRCCESA